MNERTDKRGLIAVFLLMAAALAVLCAIGYVNRSDSLQQQSAESTGGKQSYTTYYGTFEAIDSVLRQNEYMTAHPTELTEEESRWYVTAGDGGDVTGIMNEISSLSGEICAGITGDYDKAYAMALWVGENIAYDYDSEENGSDRSVICLENVLEKRRTTCGGFANLYAALCSSQEIYCLCMKGGSASEGYSRAELMEAPANHCWNAVLLTDGWYYADCTWVSDLSYSEGELVPATETRSFYALMGFGEMSIEHRIDRCEYRRFAEVRGKR